MSGGRRLQGAVTIEGLRIRIGVLLLCTAGALVYQAKRLGLTIDEPSHFAAGYMYWLGEDVLTPSDTPPLTRLIGGWVPRVMRAPDPRQTKGWLIKDAYTIGAEILSGANRARRLLFYSRLPFVVFPLLIVFLLWHWGRQLFGESIGFLLALSGALEPTIMGHGQLIKSDVPAAFAALWFTYTAWSDWRAPGVGRLLAMTLAVVVAAITKFSLLPLAPVALLLAIWKGPRLLSATIPVAVYVGILAASQFQAQPVPEAEVQRFGGAGVPAWALPGVKLLATLPWPLQFVRGLLYLGDSMQGDGYFTGYLLGHKVSGWVPAYFPIAWAIKFPIPLQLLTVAGLAALAIRIQRRQAGAGDVFVWGPAVFFFGSAVLSTFHVGFRHVLPALPFFILGGGFALQRWTGRALVAICILWLAVSSIHVFPQGISYFNEWIGGPTRGWKYLADSNIDWGHNLPELGAYMKQHRVPSIKAFIFSFDSPSHYIKAGAFEPQEMPSSESSRLSHHHRPQPGIYAIGVNHLVGLVAPKGFEDYLLWFRQRRPDARAGYSILIYDVK